MFNLNVAAGSQECKSDGDFFLFFYIDKYQIKLLLLKSVDTCAPTSWQWRRRQFIFYFLFENIK